MGSAPHPNRGGSEGRLVRLRAVDPAVPRASRREVPRTVELGVFVIVGIVTIVVVVISGVMARRARKAAQQWAAAHQWSWSATDPTLVRRWSSPPFRRGSSRSTRNVLTGTWNGRPATSFQYSYDTGSGKNRSTHYFHVVAYSLPARLPWLQLEP